MPTGLTATTFQTRSLPAGGPRSGVLAKAGLLSEFANQQSGSPTLRGKFIREALMCLTIPPPPPGVNTAATQSAHGQADDEATEAGGPRQRRLAAPSATTTWTRWDSRWRTSTPSGSTAPPTTACRSIRSGSFDGVPVVDANGLGVAASQSVTVAQCLVRRYYAYAVGHEERNVDGSALNAVATAFKASGFKMRDLILAIVTNDAFSAVAPQP